MSERTSFDAVIAFGRELGRPVRVLLNYSTTAFREIHDLDEARRECRAQVERAIYWGFDVSHLDTHMGALQMRPEFFDIYLELAADFCQ